MSQPLEGIFAELGISQYLDTFLDQGFDTWETILDITESDLDALGVKLGHRRKLQRRIANFRGLAPDAALVSPTQHSAEEQRQDAPMPDAPRTDATPLMAITKRKYRRHPKPDENAPERPPSAYVLFSNKMREDLKDRNLSFTEIAKLVGENWQALSVVEKEPYETQAQTAKDKYNSDMNEYKKTAKYRKYLSYLQDFKAKHGTPSNDKDGPKRVRMSDTSLTPSNGPGAGSTRRARSQTTSGGSSVDGRNSKHREAPPTREQRGNSTASLPEFATSSDLNSTSIDEERDSPPPSYQSSTGSPRGSDGPHASSSWDSTPEEQQPHQPQTRQHRQQQLPSLCNVLEGARQADTNGFVGSHFQLHNSVSPGSPPGLASGSSNDSRPPSLRREYSSGASTSSSAAGNGTSYPRTPIDGPLPIHLLLSGSGTAGPDSKRSTSPEQKPFSQFPPYHQQPPFHHHHHQQHQPYHSPPLSTEPSILGPGTGGGYFPAPAAPHTPAPAVSVPPNGTSAHAQLPRMLNGVGPCNRHLPDGAAHRPGLPNLDGMSALLRAGEMVDRQAR